MLTKQRATRKTKPDRPAASPAAKKKYPPGFRSRHQPAREWMPKFAARWAPAPPTCGPGGAVFNDALDLDQHGAWELNIS